MQRFPKPQVAGSIPAGGASKSKKFLDLMRSLAARSSVCEN